MWYCSTPLGHNALDNMLHFMTTRAGIIPHLTNHSIRATTITILSAANIESRHIKAITGHQSEASIQSYCDTPTFEQFTAKQCQTSLASYSIRPLMKTTLLQSLIQMFFLLPLLQANCHQQFQVLLVVEISLFSSPLKTARRILDMASFLEGPSTTAVLISMSALEIAAENKTCTD